MKKKWFRLFYFLPFALFVIFANVFIDPANIYHNNTLEMSRAMLSGKDVYSVSANLDERKLKYYMLMGLDRVPDCIAVGPSIVYSISSDITDSDSFYNLAVGGADYYDILSQFGIMESEGKLPNRVIFGVEFNFFMENLYNYDTRHEELMPYAKYMMSVLNGDHSDKPSLSRISHIKRYIRQLVSVTYFQSSFEYLKKNGVSVFGNRWGLADRYDDNFSVIKYDGSLKHGRDNRNKSLNDVIENSEAYVLDAFYHNEISGESREMFEKLIVYLNDRGVAVEIYLCPFAPALWDRVNPTLKQDYYCVSDLEEFAIYMADKYNLKITGSFNPYRLEMTNDDFYDARHPRDEIMDLYFDFSDNRL